jgi:hypothetical protein
MTTGAGWLSGADGPVALSLAIGAGGRVLGPFARGRPREVNSDALPSFVGLSSGGPLHSCDHGNEIRLNSAVKSLILSNKSGVFGYQFKSWKLKIFDSTNQ